MLRSLFSTAAIHPLATTDAVLNSVAAVLLISGFVLIKQGREQAHKWTMLAALGVSMAFLTCYLIYHYSNYLTNTHVKFGGPDAVRPIYLTILISHVILAATVPVLAIWTAVLGLKNRRRAHRKLAWVTFPIWLYVSVTGVIVYLMLYHLYPAVS